MSASLRVIEATRTNAMPSEGIRRHDRCVCHPRAWGLKKGLRRARRRVGREMIRQELRSE
jgi:hypothetical protein